MKFLASLALLASANAATPNVTHHTEIFEPEGHTQKEKVR